jgi:hypothetical protein
LLIGVGLGKPPILPTGVVGVITVGVDGRVVRSANARVPFLARFTGQGVDSAGADPVIIRCKVAVPEPHAFEQVSVTVNVPGLVGVPEILPVAVFRDKPWGNQLTPKLVGFWFVLGVIENGTPVLRDSFI